MIRRLSTIFAGGLLALTLRAQPALPPAPPQYVTDRAGVLSAGTVAELNRQLADFERTNSSQVVVWLEPKLPAGTTLEEHVNRLFKAWKIGQRGRDNGVLLAIFTEDRQMRIETGYGLEGAMPDALAGRIIRDEITPRFRTRDFDGGIRAGVNAILAATRGEYQVTGPTRTRNSRAPVNPLWVLTAAVMGLVAGLVTRGYLYRADTSATRVGQSLMGAVVGGAGHGLAALVGQTAGLIPGGTVLFLVWAFLLANRRGSEYSGRGRRDRYQGWGRGWSAGGFGGFGGGGSSGGFGGGGGFSGGGGSSGGGGASGSW